MKAFPQALTLDNLDDLLDFHRETFGGFEMIETTDDDGPDPEPDDEPDDDSDDEKDDDPGDDWQPPTRDEWEKTQSALKKANDEAKRRRLALKNVDKGDDGDTDEAAKKAAEKAVETWAPRVKKAAAKAALSDAGAVEAGRVARLVNLDELDVDDDGEVLGLEDEVDRVKEEYPELFAAKRTRGKVATGSRGGAERKKLTATERQAAALRGA